ncbi:MAG: Methionine aminopeptidase [Chlamydiia bacterium]|nr:Methionine aminopeptidase [Chlamydiia bacterium]MCH9615138.1 Methionine aminopeptidase [Chlamydiia bacterium]MCH9628540.1 Methionine aminopeptidase [Chlamydiia bacterium]
MPQGDLKDLYHKTYGIILKTPEQIAGMRIACDFASSVLKALCDAAKEGITTQALDDISMQMHKERGATAPTIGYGSPPYPKSICTSLNEVICHGIPDERPLQKGDILNIDVTSVVDGYYGDCSAMVIIGETTDEKQQLVTCAKEALMAAIDVVKPGAHISLIGEAIDTVAEKYGFSVVDEFVGHGIGLDFHEAPQVPHHLNRMQIPFAENMTFTIEPMINVGRRKSVIDPTDGWTARTVDGLPSAQWEHTLLVTKTGCEILTSHP